MRLKPMFLMSVPFWIGLATAGAAQTAGAPADAPAATPATAGTADDTAETIVVTGVRESLASAQRLKRIAPQVVDALVAEDIGKLPDFNTALSAARIPGVQVYRQGGEAQNVLVRGLPNFTTTYNGREIFTAETRVVALQDFPAANVAAIEVFKTSTADLVEPGLAGLLNVRSRRPFDFKDGEVSGSAWALYNRQGGAWKPNFNVLTTKRWDVGDGEIGVLLQGSYQDMRYLDAEISNTDFIANPTVNGRQIRLPDIQRLFYRSGNRARPSANGAIQWQVNPDVEFYAEGLWQGFRNEVDDRLLEVPLYGATYSNLVFRDGTNLVRSGVATGSPGPLFSFQGGTFNRTDTLQFAGGTRITHDRLKLNIDVARTISTFRGSTESVDRRFNGVPTVTFDLDRPQFGISGVDFASPSGQNFQGLYEENQRSAGRDWQVRADAEYAFDNSFLKNIQVGARYTDRTAVRQFGNRYAFLTPLGINQSQLPLSVEVFDGYAFQPTYNWAAPTYDSIRANVGQLRQFVISQCPRILPTDPNNGCRSYTTQDPPLANLLYTADETNWAGYAQANFGNDVIDGRIGVRYLNTKTRVAGAVPTGIPSVDAGVRNDIWLPNASLRWKATDEVQLRLSAAKTQTRPNFADLQPNLTINPPTGNPIGTDSNPRTGQGGNPFLRPFTSWNYDASLEWYFARDGFAAVTVFRRDLDGFIQPNTFRFTDPTLGVVQITGPTNTGKGRITGVEAQGQTFFDFISPALKSFGVQANVTFLDAKTQQPDGQGGLAYLPITDQLNGVSKWNYNLIGFYDDGRLSARLAYNGRSSFSATRQYRGNDTYLEFARPADRLDLSVNWNFAGNWTVFGDWTNITRTPFRQTFSSARDGAPRADYVRYLRYDDSVISLGLRFRFGV